MKTLAKWKWNAQSDLQTKLTLVTVLIGLGAVTVFYSLSDRKKEEKFYVSLNTRRDILRIPIPEEDDHSIKFYSYPLSGNKAIKFFLTKANLSRSLAYVAFEA
jgi:hypothetical protein